MTDYADLEIGLHRRDGVTWRVEVRYSQQESDADINVEGALTVDIDPSELEELELDPEAYGRTLGQALLGGDVGDAYRQAIAAAQTQGVTLRVRLFVGPSATALHGLRARIESLGGELRVESPVGAGTTLTATIPL